MKKKDKKDQPMESETLEEQISEEAVSEETDTDQSQEKDAQPQDNKANKGSKEEEMEKLQKELSTMKDLLQRRQADFENYKKRAAKIQNDYRKNAIKDLASEIILINDDLIRAIEASSHLDMGGSCEDTHESFLEGVSMISRRIEDSLKKFGIEEIDAEGQEFNPNFHEAVEIENSSDIDLDTVTKVYQKGFKIEDLVVRSAMVRVAKPASQEMKPEVKDLEEKSDS